MIRTTQCIYCGKNIDKFHGELVNLSDDALRDFYNIPYVNKFLQEPNHKHVTLCASCLTTLLDRHLRLSDLKVKNGKLMTSNIAYLLKLQGRLTEQAINILVKQDKCGLTSHKFKEVSYIQCLKNYYV